MPKKQVKSSTPGAAPLVDPETLKLQECNAEVVTILKKYGYDLKIQQQIVFEKLPTLKK